MGDDSSAQDLQRIKQFYDKDFLPKNAWSTLLPRPYLYLRQRQRRLRDSLLEAGFGSAAQMRQLDILEVGAGTGTNMAWLLELGADPARCTGIDLLPASVAAARERLPSVRWLSGDFSTTDVGGPFDVVAMIAVITSVKDAGLKKKIMEKCLASVRPGGIFFFYDFMCYGEDPGSEHYKQISYKEFDAYLGGRKARWFKRDLLRGSLAESLVPRFGVVAAELLQALRIFNIEGSFAYVRC